jgi:TDG/mug DNA glycosylase family protein
VLCPVLRVAWRGLRESREGGATPTALRAGRVGRAVAGLVRREARLARARSSLNAPSDVPDVLAPGLTAIFVGINPGRVSAAAGAHFANPRNDFWRLLHEAGFTPRLYDPSEQFGLLPLGYGVTNAAYRTTPGSSDLRRSDFAGSRQRLEQLVRELRPRALAFVGKEAYRGAFGERAELGPQERRLGETALFVLPSTSPANAAVPYAERLRWFQALATTLAT